MSKRTADTIMGNNEKKHIFINVTKCRAFAEVCARAWPLTEEYDFGTTTLYDLKNRTT